MESKSRQRQGKGATKATRLPKPQDIGGSRTIHADLRRLFRRPQRQPLSLAQVEYEAAESEFVARETSRLLKLSSVAPSLEGATPWIEIAAADVQKLEMCRLRMAFANDGTTYEAARKEFESLIQGWIPPRRKWGQVRRLLFELPRTDPSIGPFPLARLLASQSFFWAVMRGEYLALGKDAAAVARDYGYLECTHKADFKARLIGPDKPTELADQDAVTHFGLDLESTSLRKLIDAEVLRHRHSGA